MNKPLKTGIVLGAGSQLTNIISRSPIGTEAYDNIGASYNLEHFINGATQAGALAGVTITAYGLTKAVVRKCIPITSEKTRIAVGLTNATAVVCGIVQTDVFQKAMQDMSMYDYQIQRGLETMTTVGIGVGLGAVGVLFVKDIYDWVASRFSSKKQS